MQGRPKEPWEEQWVCRLDPTTLAVEKLFPLEWIPDRGGHLMSDGGLLLRDDEGDDLLLAGRIHTSRGLQPGGAYIVRRHLPDGAASWVTYFDAPFTGLADLKPLGMTAFALADGQIGLIDNTSGSVSHVAPVTIDSVPVMILSLAARGEYLAAGTSNGRVILYDVIP